MGHLPQYTVSLLLVLLLNTSATAQRNDDFFQAVDADILQVQDTSHFEYTLKGATVLLQNGSGQLNLKLNIPYAAVTNKPFAISEFSTPGYLFQLKVDIDPTGIQNVLTSTKTFLTQGMLTLNNITKPVPVSYIPVVSGDNETGNFSIYMTIQFSAAGFNLAVPGIDTRFVLKIDNAKVNRL